MNKNKSAQVKIVTKDILSAIYKKRPGNVKKYDYGLLMVIGGSEFYTGSPALSALAAFRAGVDMVRILAPKRAADIIASFAPDLAAYPLEGVLVSEEHLSLLLAMSESARIAARKNAAVVVGGGLGRSDRTQKAILDYLSQLNLPAVVDADGIYALAKKPEICKGKPFLITPHLYEFFILTGKEIGHSTLEEKIKTVQEEAKRLQTTILLKGEIDIISDGAQAAINKTGSPYMTVGGTGDTLAGIAGAFLARGINVFQSGQAAAYLNGAAGALAAKQLRESLMATDLIAAIPKILK